MKILHYSDQSSPDFLALYNLCDVLVVTGDLSLSDFNGLEDMTIRKPAFGVYGNHDLGNYLEKLNINNLHQKVLEFGGLRWGGWQGCLKYKESASPMFTEEMANDFTNNFPLVDILLLHAGPKGMLDDPIDSVHTGSENISRYVLEKKPHFVFCGHQYSNNYLDVGTTKIYRTYGARIIEI